ncbi:MAG: hypothetical protein V3T72_20810 [Thermoanaerobaculia bacterium]
MTGLRSPFYRLHQLAERCFGHLDHDFHPRDIWNLDDPQRLADALQTLRGVIEGLDSGLQRLAADADERFQSVIELEEWEAIENEAPEWERALGNLRPAADTEYVKQQLLGIRVRISELVDGLAVRSAVRDPGNRADNSHQAVESVARLQKERTLREITLSLLEGVTWQDTLDATVAEWGIHFGPQHRIELGRLCDQLVAGLQKLRALSGSGAATGRLVQSTAATCDKIEFLNQRLSEIPVTQADAGTASDFHYMAELVQQVVKAVRRNRAAILKDYSGRQLAPAIVNLFQLMNLKVPKTQPQAAIHGTPHPRTREELERELGRHIISPVKKQEQEPD